MASADVLPPAQAAPALPADQHEDDDDAGLCLLAGEGSPGTGESDYEQSAVAALLGLAALPCAPFQAEAWGGVAKRELPAAPPGDAQSLWRDPSSDDLSSEGTVKRQRTEKDFCGAPPPGTCRFQCKYPQCLKMYSSTDAVRKHCRKRHLEWLRKLDQLAAHDRHLPKPSLYCRWGSDTELP